jgi:hypothetical protein
MVLKIQFNKIYYSCFLLSFHTKSVKKHTVFLYQMTYSLLKYSSTVYMDNDYKKSFNAILNFLGLSERS